MIVILVGCSSGVSTKADKRKLCEALAISAGALSNESLKHASEEYAATDRAIRKWEQWDAKTITAEQDRAGDYSGAWQRAQTYARAGNAFCNAALVHAWELQELARITGDADVIEAAQRLTNNNIFCSWHGDGTARERKTFLNEWQRTRSMLVAAATDSVDACFKKFGGAPPLVHTPGLWVPME